MTVLTPSSVQIELRDAAAQQGRTFISSGDTAKYLGIGHSTLKLWRSKGYGPAYTKVGRNLRYDLGELDRWLTAQTVESTS